MAKCFELWRSYFDKANDLLDAPGKHYNVNADCFTMPAIIFRAGKGGNLATRAAAFESRHAVVMCIDGVYCMLETAMNIFLEGTDAWAIGDAVEFDRLCEDDPSSWTTIRRWFHDDLKYTLCIDSAFEEFEVFEIYEAMMLANGVAQKIRMPAFIDEAAEGMFFDEEPARVAEEIGSNATLQRFQADLGADLHCQVGALV